jgi:hypothetical protein
LSETLKRRDDLEEFRVNGMIILKWFSRNCGGNIQTGSMMFRLEHKG